MNEEMNIDLPTAQAMTITAATELARLWLASQPAALAYLKTDWGLAVEVKLSPAPACLMVSFIDPADGMRYPHARLELPAAVV